MHEHLTSEERRQLADGQRRIAELEKRIAEIESKPKPGSRKAGEQALSEALRTRTDSISADIAGLKHQQKQIEQTVRSLTLDEMEENAAIRGRYNAVYDHIGRATPEPLAAERPLMYQRRLLRGICRYHPEEKYKNINFQAVNDSIAVSAIEGAIIPGVMARADAILLDAKDDELIRKTIYDRVTGRPVHTFHGRHTFISAMKPPIQKLGLWKSGKHFRDGKASPPDQPLGY